MQQGGIERAGTQLRDREIEIARRGGRTLRSRAVAASGARLGALVAAGTDLRGCFGIDEVLQAGLEEAAEQFLVSEVEVLEQFSDKSGQGRLVVGRRLPGAPTPPRK